MRVIRLVDIGGFIFKDANSLEAWTSTVGVGDDVLGNFCMDFISLLTLTQDPFMDVSAGMQAYVAVVKTCFKDLNEDHVPRDNYIATKAAEGVVRGGYYWAPTFKLANIF